MFDGSLDPRVPQGDCGGLQSTAIQQSRPNDSNQGQHIANPTMSTITLSKHPEALFHVRSSTCANGPAVLPYYERSPNPHPLWHGELYPEMTPYTRIYEPNLDRTEASDISTVITVDK
jgi:hypothetical protein